MVDQKVRQHRIQYILWRQFPQHNRDWLNYFTAIQDAANILEERRVMFEQVSPMLNALRNIPDLALLRFYIEMRRQEYTEQEAQENHRMQPIYETWAKMAYWTIDESIALLLGCNPRQVSLEKVLPLLDNPFATRYIDLHDIATRAVVAQQLYVRNAPSYFLAWAGRIEIFYPPELELEVVSLGDQIADWKTAYDKLEEGYKAVNAALDGWKKQYNELEMLNSSNVTEANNLIQERDNLIEVLWGEILEARDIALPPPEAEYTSPYLELMQRAIVENEITTDSQSKKEVLVEWFMHNAPEGMPMSKNKAGMMATLIRLPEAEVGGNKKPRNPSTPCDDPDVDES